jgi:hypothetical protein
VESSTTKIEEYTLKAKRFGEIQYNLASTSTLLANDRQQEFGFCLHEWSSTRKQTEFLTHAVKHNSAFNFQQKKALR